MLLEKKERREGLSSVNSPPPSWTKRDSPKEKKKKRRGGKFESLELLRLFQPRFGSEREKRRKEERKRFGIPSSLPQKGKPPARKKRKKGREVFPLSSSGKEREKREEGIADGPALNASIRLDTCPERQSQRGKREKKKEKRKRKGEFFLSLALSLTQHQKNCRPATEAEGGKKKGGKKKGGKEGGRKNRYSTFLFLPSSPIPPISAFNWKEKRRRGGGRKKRFNLILLYASLSSTIRYRPNWGRKKGGKEEKKGKGGSGSRSPRILPNLPLL